MTSCSGGKSTKVATERTLSDVKNESAFCPQADVKSPDAGPKMTNRYLAGGLVDSVRQNLGLWSESTKGVAPKAYADE
jgi:hypothetical protein